MKNSKYNLIIIIVIAIVTFHSCKKDEEQVGYLEPIKIVSPSTNPAEVQSKSNFTYKIGCTTDEYIDSVMVYVQPDSLAMGYKENIDTVLNYKVKYPVGQQANVQTIQNSYQLGTNLRTGSKLYFRFNLKSKTHNYNKVLTLNVI